MANKFRFDIASHKEVPNAHEAFRQIYVNNAPTMFETMYISKLFTTVEEANEAAIEKIQNNPAYRECTIMLKEIDSVGNTVRMSLWH